MTVLATEPDVLFIAEVAAYLRLSPRAIYRLIRAGTFCPETRRIDQRRRWRKADLDAWLAAPRSMRLRMVSR